MIAAARRRAGLRGRDAQCRFLVQDLATLDAGAKYDLVLSVTVLQHILDAGALRASLLSMARHLDRDGRLVLLEAAPARRSTRCDSAIFRARTRASYLQLFEQCGLEVRAMSGVDPAPFRPWLLPHLPALSPGVRLLALAAATAASLPIDMLFGRALLARSWHTVFVLAHARNPHAR
jgi:SAM-dependent methyltransferase